MKLTTKSRIAATLILLALLASAVPTFAQAAFPTKPIVCIVPFSPGGGNDILVRLLSKYANRYLGQTLVVENKPGASGQIGWTALAKSKADGYTLGATSLPSMILIKAIRPATPFELDDFRYICNIQIDPIIWVVKSDSRFKTAKDFVEQASAKKLNVAGDGPQSNVQLQHLAATKALGIQTNFISYSGSGPAITSLLGGQVELAATTLSSAIPNIEAGKLRALVVFSEDPIDALPGVPLASAYFGKTIPSVGMAIRGLAAPKDIAADRITILEKAFRQICESKEFLEEAKGLGIIVKFQGSAEAEAIVKSSITQVEELKELLQ
jgi:tripartite-type tricarboxylate transporter receptor subunit TctC